tara:strand:+ start:22 stop:1056 length:1035 start_codon:yes stop_codon:yes gene_type:complete
MPVLIYLIIILNIAIISEVNAQIKLHKVSEKMVYVSPPFKECHASTIVEVEKNRFLITAFGGSKEGNKDVSIWLSKNLDNNWLKPKIIDTGTSSDGRDYPCWNPVLFKSRSGKLTLFYKVGPSPREWWGMYKTSSDNGKNWSSSTRLPNGILGPIKNKPIQLENGTIISPSSTEIKNEEGISWKIHVEMSHDDGANWKKIQIDQKTKFDVIQPSVLIHDEGKLQLLCRSRNNSLMQAYSNDNGLKWGKVTRTKLPNPNSGTDAITLKNGYHLLVYNPLKNGGDDRKKLSVAVSKNGIDWEDQIILEEKKGFEFSYPAVIESLDGKIHISYTYDRKNIKHVILTY